MRWRSCIAGWRLRWNRQSSSVAPAVSCSVSSAKAKVETGVEVVGTGLMKPCGDTASKAVQALAKLSMAGGHFPRLADFLQGNGDVENIQVDNRDLHLLLRDEALFNIPAIAAAKVIERHVAQTPDELSFEVGDIVCITEMLLPKEVTLFWRGKLGFKIGNFPSGSVELINRDTQLSALGSDHSTKRVIKIQEKVFGEDLARHLGNSAHDVPQVLTICTELIEKHGIVSGIYRCSGLATDIKQLRKEFNSGKVPDLTEIVQRIHCFSNLCKLYFRELPDPLLTYKLYDKFTEALVAPTEHEKLLRMQDVIQLLPGPNYRTLQHLMRHLSLLESHADKTKMTSMNLSIMWGPNLLRRQTVEGAASDPKMVVTEMSRQSMVTEFLLKHTEELFGDCCRPIACESAGGNSLLSPEPLVSSPSITLVSLEEAQAQKGIQSGVTNATNIADTTAATTAANTADTTNATTTADTTAAATTADPTATATTAIANGAGSRGPGM
ncbi:rho GTPase-activating protein 32-like [Lethenteron reissneri]|uniref:rho GTPase-activating protein 32-like n=1 Tax=Lethenteron reissneri TaxID=7753 RepID=UPI002AB73F25|nr:rho GTPase-activating protein 32-like [Lethenteron reissneri]